MFERFTERARTIVVLAQEEARMLQHDHIGTEHLLLALLQPGPGDQVDETGQALLRVGVELDDARRYVVAVTRRARKPSDHLSFTPRAKQVLELALRVSLLLDVEWIDAPHLLRAILRLPECTAGQLLVAFGVDTDALARTADELGRRVLPTMPVPTVSAAQRHSLHQAGTRLDELLDQCQQLRTALLRFGRHDTACVPETGCTCGFQEALDRFDRPVLRGWTLYPPEPPAGEPSDRG